MKKAAPIWFLLISLALCRAAADYQPLRPTEDRFPAPVQPDSPAIVDSRDYSIDVPYEFPVRPGMPEWEELAQAGLGRNACRMPTELAEEMTAEALLETALTYPYVIDILAHSDPVQGFWSNAKYNDALEELVTRPDAASVVEQAFNKLPELVEISDAETMERWYLLSAFSKGLAKPPQT